MPSLNADFMERLKADARRGSGDRVSSRPARVLTPLEQLLAGELAKVGVDFVAAPVAAFPPLVPVRAIWDAFRAFSAAPLDSLPPGFHITTAGDSLWFEPRPAREAVPNIPACAPGLTMSRRVWLANEDGEDGREELASLTFELVDDLAAAVGSERPLYDGAAGPAAGEARLAWIGAVEQSTFRECLSTPRNVVLVGSD